MIDKKEQLEWLDSLPEFKTVDYIPDLPCYNDSDFYFLEVVPIIIRKGGIPKKDLIEGKIYIGSCRNASEAVWNGHEFEYKRFKWGFDYIDCTPHFEDEAYHDMFIPIKLKN